MYFVQYLGRWGSNTVARYAAEALNVQLAKASTARASGMIGGGRDADDQLRKTIRELVKEAIEQEHGQGSESTQAFKAVADAPAEPGVPLLPTDQQVQGTRNGKAVGFVHDVLWADRSLPPAAWVTRCSWRFGASPHSLLSGEATTCSRCLQSRVVANRKALQG